MERKFRFGVQTSKADSGEAWRAKARRIEELGYSSLLVPDHFGDQFAPLLAMQAAGDATTTLRVGGLVLDNDFRHPIVLAKEAATLDVLTGGRFELGIGAGWMTTDYEQSGMPYERPGIRIEKLRETIKVLTQAFSMEPVNLQGKHYTITNWDAQPKPVQQPLPIMIGGGGKRVLSLAGREANIISVNFNLEQGAVNQKTLQSGAGATTDEKVGWIKAAAGERFGEIELNVTVFVAIVTDDRQKMAERVAPAYGMGPDEVLDSPHVLIGTVDQMADTLQRRRERFGFSYIAFSGDGFEALAPVVQKLSGT